MHRIVISLTTALVAGVVCCGQAHADPPILSTPTSEHFNGISYAPDGSFGVAIGNAGVIVHVDADHPGGELVTSGTAADLHDVHVVDRNFAVISGEALLLTWDGLQWTTHDSSGPLLPVWGSPEKDIVMFDFYSAGGPFDFRGAFDPVANAFLPGAYAGPLDLDFCGNSNDIKLVNEEGDTEVIGNDRGTVLVDGNPVAFDNPAPLSLSAAWIPPEGCQIGPLVPTSAFGINAFNDIWHFDGASWTRQLDTPADQHLTWISGTANDHVFAVGYKDSVDSPGTNQGVVWQFDGASWSDVTSTLFSSEIPGLTDLDATYSFQSCVHVGGFEDGETAQSANCEQPAASCAIDDGPGECFTLRVSAEYGGIVAIDSAAAPAARVNMRVSAGRSIETVGSNPPEHVAQIRFINSGPAAAQNVSVRAYVDTGGQAVTVSCPASLDELNVPPGLMLLHGVLPTLAAESVFSCELRSPGPVSLSLSAYAAAPTEIDLSNNRIDCPASQSFCAAD